MYRGSISYIFAIDRNWLKLDYLVLRRQKGESGCGRLSTSCTGPEWPFQSGQSVSYFTVPPPALTLHRLAILVLGPWMRVSDVRSCFGSE